MSLLHRADVLRTPASPRTRTRRRRHTRRPRFMLLSTTRRTLGRHTGIVDHNDRNTNPSHHTGPIRRRVASQQVAQRTSHRQRRHTRTVSGPRTRRPSIQITTSIFRHTVTRRLPTQFTHGRFTPILTPRRMPRLVANVATTRHRSGRRISIRMSTGHRRTHRRRSNFTFRRHT